MKYINFLDREFLQYDLEDKRFLLQLSDLDNPMEPSLVKIGEEILTQYSEEVDELVACNSELMFYMKNDNFDSFLANISTKNLNLKIQKPATYQVPVDFNMAKDWEEVENQIGIPKAEIIDRILAHTFTFDHYGFRPGFFYLHGLEEDLHCLRKEVPDIDVQAGSIGLGGEYIGIYGQASPAGWQIIGTIDEKLNKLLPSIIKIGDRIKFIVHE